MSIQISSTCVVSPLTRSRIIASELLEQEVAVHDGLILLQGFLGLTTCAVLFLDASCGRERLHQRIEVGFEKERDPIMTLEPTGNKVASA